MVLDGYDVDRCMSTRTAQQQCRACFQEASGEYCHAAYYHFFFNDTATTEIYTLSLHDALPIYSHPATNGHTDTEAPSGAITHGCSCSRSRHRRSSGCSDSPGRPSWSPPTWPAGTATTKIGRAHV